MLYLFFYVLLPGYYAQGVDNSTEELQEIALDQNMTRRQFFQQYFTFRNKLHEDLLKGYNRMIPGLFLGDRYGQEAEPLYCNVTLMYANLLSIEERKQSVLMIVDFVYEWKDYRLCWDPADYGGIEQIGLVKKEQVWVPDVVPYDILGYMETLPEDRQTVSITSNGELSLYVSTVTEFVCRVDLINFPFDNQHCNLSLNSNFAPVEELLVIGTINPQMMYTAGNGEWIYQNVSVKVNLWASRDYSYQTIFFEFSFCRTSTYYIMQIIIPSFVLTALCEIGLFWSMPQKDSYMETLNLGFAAILAMMFVLQMTTQDMPRINQVDKLSRYSLINLGLITVSSIVVICIGKFCKPKREKVDKNAPWLSRLRLNVFLLILSVGASVINLIVLVA